MTRMDSKEASQPEPARFPAGAEALLVFAKREARLVVRAGRLRAGEEVDVDAADAAGAELDVATPGTVVEAFFAGAACPCIASARPR